MRITHTSLILSNSAKPEMKPLYVGAMADTGALFLCITQHVANQLQLEEIDKREVTLADGSKKIAPLVGNLMVQFANRKTVTSAVVMGDEVLLGAIPMEDLDLVVHPGSRQVLVNPENPNIAAGMAKGFKA